MEWTAQEERQILDGLKTFVEVFARSIAEQSEKKSTANHLAQTKPKRETEPTKPVQGSAGRANLPHLIPVTKWTEHHEYPSISSLRWLIFNAERTGFKKVIRRVGRRVLIDEAAFFEWVREGGESPRS